jgi:GrpB-like predicted nucleotidyltransferase (UPF0157 family)
MIQELSVKPYVVEVVPYNPNWASLFQTEAEQIIKVLGEEVVKIHHVGSTAIPGIYAKPIIDFLVEVRHIDIIDNFNENMQTIGYEAHGEYGIPGRRFFTKEQNHKRTHHVHIFRTRDPEFQRHLAFRDYLNAHPEEAQRYSRLKQKLAHEFSKNSVSYTSGKDDFIRAVERKAIAWLATNKVGFTAETLRTQSF